jgi:hypothetical protein
MTEAEWLTCQDAREMLGRCPHGFSPRKMRLFTVACCRCSRQLLLNADLRAAVDLAEQFADGNASEQEMAAAYRRADTYAVMSHDGEAEREIHRWCEAVAVLIATRTGNTDGGDAVWHINRATNRRSIDRKMAELLRDIVGNPYRAMSLVRPHPEWLTPKVLEAIPAWPEFDERWFNPAWLTSDVLALARGIYAEKAFDRMPILADALQDAGCDNEQVLNHCRYAKQVHVRGCWVVDLLLEKP